MNLLMDETDQNFFGLAIGVDQLGRHAQAQGDESFFGAESQIVVIR
jgi:hypothetical protein